MARFDIYRNQSGSGLLLDIQADMLSELNTRVVVPLIPLDEAPQPAKKLNPVFDVDGAKYSMVTQYMAAVHVKELKSIVLNARNRNDEITGALDFLMQGY